LFPSATSGRGAQPVGDELSPGPPPLVPSHDEVFQILFLDLLDEPVGEGHAGDG